MRRFLCFILAFLFIANFVGASEGCQNCKFDTIPEKLYLQASQIQITDNNIIFEYEGHLYATDTLCVDQGGIYVLNQNWRCPRCNRQLDMRGYCWTPGCKNYGKQP